MYVFKAFSILNCQLLYKTSKSGGIMTYRLLLIFLVWSWTIIPTNIYGQTDKNIASQFSVHIFSSASFMGYLEPCG